MKNKKINLIISIIDFIIGLIGLIVFITIWIMKGFSYEICLAMSLSILFIVSSLRRVRGRK